MSLVKNDHPEFSLWPGLSVYMGCSYQDGLRGVYRFVFCVMGLFPSGRNSAFRLSPFSSWRMFVLVPELVNTPRLWDFLYIIWGLLHALLLTKAWMYPHVKQNFSWCLGVIVSDCHRNATSDSYGCQQDLSRGYWVMLERFNHWGAAALQHSISVAVSLRVWCEGKYD